MCSLMALMSPLVYKTSAAIQGQWHVAEAGFAPVSRAMAGLFRRSDLANWKE